ncbi:MAG: hypothetical protein DRI94_13805 [Bacteroidetes bacterium]|nr:MAG: hypothetical protein DRI94_13805 [Bacteroidota bacterium]
MIFKIFNTKHPFILILIFIIDFAFSLFFYFNTNTTISDAHIYKSVFNNFFYNLNHNYNLLSRILFSIIVFSQALYLSYLNKKHFFISERTFLPSILYLLIMSLNKNTQEFSGVILSNFFIFLIIDQLFSSYKKNNAITNFFNSGFFLAIATLLYFDNIFFVIIIFIGFIILRQFYWREWVAGFIGLLSVFIIYFLLTFIIYGGIDFSKYSFYFTKVTNIAKSYKNIIFLGYIALILLLAIINLIKKYGTKKISTRKFMLIFIWILFINIILFLSVKFLDFRILFISFMPVSYLLTMYFINLRNRIWQEILFSILIFSYIAFQIF